MYHLFNRPLSNCFISVNYVIVTKVGADTFDLPSVRFCDSKIEFIGSSDVLWRANRRIRNNTLVFNFIFENKRSGSSALDEFKQKNKVKSYNSHNFVDTIQRMSSKYLRVGYEQSKTNVTYGLEHDDFNNFSFCFPNITHSVDY